MAKMSDVHAELTEKLGREPNDDDLKAYVAERKTYTDADVVELRAELEMSRTSWANAVLNLNTERREHDRYSRILVRKLVDMEEERDVARRERHALQRTLDSLQSCENCGRKNEVSLCENCADEQARADAADHVERQSFFGGAR